MPFWFANPWMLAGTAALTIPILIHLLLKRKKKRLRFSTLQFFQRQDEQSSQRRKLRNWLLLAIRLMIVALLVLTFARPFLTESQAGAGATPRRQVVLVLDRSVSMRTVGTAGSRWAQARELVNQIMRDLHPDDRLALVSCSTQAEVVSGFAPPATVAKALGELTPLYGTSNLGEGLKQAAALVRTADAKLPVTVYVVSDLQRSACQQLSAFPIPSTAEVKTLAVGDLYTPNLALAELTVDAQTELKPHASVANFSDEDKANVAVELVVDDKPATSRMLSIKSGATTNVEFSLPAIKPGWHTVRAALTGKDALEADNTRWAAFFVPEPVRVLLVETRKTQRSFERESFFLELALDPARNATNAIPTVFQIATASPEEVAGKLGAAPGPRAVDVVILPGLRQVPAGLGKALTDFVNAGGGLLMFLGDGISANRYEGEFRGLLPAQLGSFQGGADDGSAWHLGDHDTNSTVFAPFRLPNSGDLRLPEFTKRFSISPASGAALLAAFEDQMPFLLAGSVGRGRVLLANTTADTTWTDWPKHKTFVPWLHGLGKYLAPKSGLDQAWPTNLFLAGEASELELGPALRKSPIRLQPINGKEISATADNLGRIHVPHLDTPGIYRLCDQAGHELRRVAVNVPPLESDLAALRPAEFEQRLARLSETDRATLTARVLGADDHQREYWRALLLAVLALLIIETVVSNRTLA
jgi:hypothetical protein